MKFTNIDKIYGVVLYAIIVVAFLYTQGCTLVGLKINDLLNEVNEEIKSMVDDLKN